jgi:hypothetical protein
MSGRQVRRESARHPISPSQKALTIYFGFEGDGAAEYLFSGALRVVDGRCQSSSKVIADAHPS